MPGKQINVTRARIYIKSIIHRTIFISMNAVSESIKQTLEDVVRSDIEGKCTVDGFIKPNSCTVLSYSAGKINGADVRYDVIVECFVCNPPEGMVVSCYVRNITRAGIRAEVGTGVIPLVVFISRDHIDSSVEIPDYQINQEISVRLIGTRFELEDPYISAIAEIVL
jgi:DNA-directed RNA polymerase subunit E'/Rpb7